MWEGSSSLGEDGYIFFHILDSGYGTPQYVSFWRDGVYVNDDPQLPTYPVDVVDIATKLVEEARTRSEWYTHNQLLIPFGTDFTHTNSYQDVLQMEKVMKVINSNSTFNMTIKWSTLADYVQSVNALNLTWKLEQPDFFPYVDSPHGVFSGFSVHTKLQ